MFNFFRPTDHGEGQLFPAAIGDWAPPPVSNGDALLDAAALKSRIADWTVECGGPDKCRTGKGRQALLGLMKAALKSGESEVRNRFLNDFGTGDDCVRNRVHVLDQLIRTLADISDLHLFPAPNPTTGERFAIVALGGYGRGELAPKSDIDLLFLLPYKRTPRVEQVVEFMLYLLWDLGLRVGHAVRSVDDCIRTSKTDMTIRTSLLECRPLWGEPALVEELFKRYKRDIVDADSKADFVEAKLAERDARHRKLGDSRYVMEPNVKDGKGGLRDLQSLFWIAKYLFQVRDIDGMVAAGVLNDDEAARFRKALSFFRAVRCHLHYLTGREEDRLTFDLQREIGPAMGYTDHAGASGVERFMKHYFLIAKDVGDLTRIFCAALEADSRRKPRRFMFFLGGAKEVDGFVVDRERLTFPSERHLRDTPIDMLRLFRVAQDRDLDIHPAALKAITRSLKLIGNKLRNDPAANALFLDILTSPNDPEKALRRMNESGVLARFLPDFGRVVAQMQYDMYHVYTVDEHTMFAIGILHRIENGAIADEMPLATSVFPSIKSRRALFVAMLLHDIAKGRGGDHSVLGAKVARKLCPRLGLSTEETETVEWLVLNHLAMNDTALKRDIEDDQTVRDFVGLVESAERLRLLLVLTCADIRAVGPGRWNGWKGSLLGQLYNRTRHLIADGFDFEGTESRVNAAHEAIRTRLTAAGWSDDAVAAFLGKGYPPYWLSLDTDTHCRHAALVVRAERQDDPLIVDARPVGDQGTTEVTVLTPDHPGLIARVAGALAVAGANIVDAKIFTLTTGLAIDLFNVQGGADTLPFDDPDALASLSDTVSRCLAGTIDPTAELERQRSRLPTRTNVFRVQPRVLIDNAASRTHSVIEVNGRDRPGLLYDLTRALSGMALQISSAKISTFGERAIDVFYVKDVFGLKVTNETKLEQIRSHLTAVLADGDPGSVPPAPAPTRPARRRLGKRPRMPAGTQGQTAQKP
ncbi:[protein-PII] uridylyltransferase [Fodinicurvata sp. EGI_FJ10296]|uniref:[protein-PII] uridylyltransferase n=1 Tax=Fodinicurvata sp. EGI_FJ10296 TaxID=3231908 RepID=UPI003456FDCC